MIWYDMIWYGVVWYGMKWYDMIWYVWYDIWYMKYDIWYMTCDIWYIYDMIWYDMTWYDMIWYDMIWYEMRWYDIWYDMILYYMVWYDMIWYDMILYGMYYIYNIWSDIIFDQIWYVIYMIYYIWYMIYDIWYYIPKSHISIHAHYCVHNNLYNQSIPSWVADCLPKLPTTACIASSWELIGIQCGLPTGRHAYHHVVHYCTDGEEVGWASIVGFVPKDFRRHVPKGTSAFGQQTFPGENVRIMNVYKHRTLEIKWYITIDYYNRLL